MMNGPSSTATTGASPGAISGGNNNNNGPNSSNSGGNKQIPNAVIGGATMPGSGNGNSAASGPQDAMSSLKNIAQEAISRSVGLGGAGGVGGAAPDSPGAPQMPTSMTGPNSMLNMPPQQMQGSNSNNSNLVASLMAQQLQQERLYGTDAIANGNVAVSQGVNPQQQQQQQVMGSSGSGSSSSTATTTTTAGNNSGSVTSGLGPGLKPGTNVAHIPPLLGVAPLGPSPLQKEHQFQVRSINLKKEGNSLAVLSIRV